MNHSNVFAIGFGGLTMAISLLPLPKASGQVVWSAAGSLVSIQPSVDAFRGDLGTLNPNVASSFASGRREINWDGVPDTFAAPNSLPANFFNVNSPRGVVFSTPGTGFQVSANAANASSTPIEFGQINPSYPSLFTTFSPQRLFTALGSTILDVGFFLPGTTTPALTRGFGAVFTDVDLGGVSRIQFFDVNNTSLGAFDVPAAGGDQTLSFLGVSFADPIVSRVRMTAGNEGFSGGTANGDVVVMDDFIYGEPSGGASVPDPLNTLGFLMATMFGLWALGQSQRAGLKNCTEG